jgi:acyl carrier protein
VEESHIYTKLAVIFEDVFDDDSISVSPELTAKNVDGWDSLAHIRLMLAVEKAFGVKFSNSEVNKLQSVGELVELIRARA